MKALGYIFIFYVGFYFYRLGENHKKMKWLCALLGIASYFIGQVTYLLYIRFFTDSIIEEADLHAFSLKSFLVGFTTVVILFNVLNFAWTRKKKSKNEVDNIGKQ